MKHLIYIFIIFFVLCSTANTSYGQFWKKKTSNTTTKDTFSGKSKKGPNVYSSKPPKTKSRSKLYSHSISKKKLRKKNKSTFSATKSRYNVGGSKSKNKGEQGVRSSSGGRKSGKGRKKEN